MALADFLYRCPRCGTDPTVPEGKTRARCTGCGREFVLAGGGREILVRLEGHEERATPSELSRALARRGGAIAVAENAGGRLVHESEVRIRVATAERPVRYLGRLLGFFERFGPAREGRLSLAGERLRFQGIAEEESREWHLDEIRALQSSSSSLQISPAAGGVVLFRFPSDSSRRWEELLAEALRRRWRELGRGEIVELQPRIRTG